MSVIKKRSSSHLIDVYKLWCDDALKRKWKVQLKKMNSDDLYYMTQPTPDWENMDPYSGIEDEADEPSKNGSDASVDKPSEIQTDTRTPDSSYTLRPRTRLIVTSGTRKSSRSVKRTNYNDTVDDSDSDFEPHPKRVRTKNPGLRAPSQARINARHFNKKVRNIYEDIHDEKDYPMIPTPADRNKKCPHCNECFFYETGVNTHLTHAHMDLIQQGIIDKLPSTAKSPPPGINKDGPDDNPPSRVGTTLFDSDVREKDSPLSQGTVKGTNSTPTISLSNTSPSVNGINDTSSHDDMLGTNAMHDLDTNVPTVSRVIDKPDYANNADPVVNDKRDIEAGGESTLRLQPTSPLTTLRLRNW